MHTSEPNPSAYRQPVECIRAARSSIADLTHSLQVADDPFTVLNEAAEQLQQAADLLRSNETADDDAIRLEVDELRRQLKTLSAFLAESERLVKGWLGRLGT